MRRPLKDQLWRELGIQDTQPFVCERDVVWRGTKRTVEFIFGNVRDTHLPDDEFAPQQPGNLRIVFDYPFDDGDHGPVDDLQRVDRLRRAGRTEPTLVWLPDFFSEQTSRQLGRLLKINYLLERDRLDEHTATRPAEERAQIRNQLKASRDNISGHLTEALLQLYGINRAEPEIVGATVPDGQHLVSLLPGFTRTRPEPSVGFEQNLLLLADGMFAARYPKHPDFDPRLTRKAVTVRELKTTMEWIARAMEDGSRRVVVESHQLPVVRKIVHALGLGEVHDGPLNVSNDWRLRINKKAAESPDTGDDLAVETIREWITDLGYEGLDRNVTNLIIATYALLDDRTWIYQTQVVPQAPELDRIVPGYGLRAVTLPDEDTFATALRRAGAVFGQSMSPVLFARNVARLAAQVRAVAEEHRMAVGETRTLLQDNAVRLGLEGPGGADAPRLKSTKAAADLIARLLRTTDATLLTNELADATYEVTDREIGAALKQAPEVLRVLRTLRDTRWSDLDMVRELASRDDGVGDRARRLLDTVRRAANAHEEDESLVPVLDSLQESAVALMREATRLAQAARPVEPTPRTEPSAEDVRLTEHGTPSVPSVPTVPEEPGGEATAPGPARQDPRVRYAAEPADPPAAYVIEPTRLEMTLAATVDGLSADIRRFLTAHPGTRVQVTWQVIEDAHGETGAADRDDKGTER
ncbi:hypothetical protein ABZ557_25795 [Streptomyces sp. NPDC019645]|uniref:hypothetical protein n=1 Tax=Streptomyces sp. NPDC019645 TaxID=3154786 RepID=UPI0033DAD1E1